MNGEVLIESSSAVTRLMKRTLKSVGWKNVEMFSKYKATTIVPLTSTKSYESS